MQRTFTFGSKLKILGVPARLTFASDIKNQSKNYLGTLTFYGDGFSLDQVMLELWKRTTKQPYPFPIFRTRIKSLDIQLIDKGAESLFVMQVIVNDLEVRLYFVQDPRLQTASAQVISVSSASPLSFESIPGIDFKLEEPIVLGFVFHIASQRVTIPSNHEEQKDREFTKGFSYDLNLKLPELPFSAYTFAVPAPSSSNAISDEPFANFNETPSEELAQANTKWFEVNKKIGILDVERVGLQFKDGKVWTMLFVDLNFQKLVFTLKGLRLGYPVKAIQQKKAALPTFDLDGIGVAFESPVLNAAGFLEQDRTKSKRDFIGSINLQTPVFSIFGAGAYGRINGSNSAFIYAMVGYPINIPALAMIDGLALGFGYNRQVIVPPIEQLDRFPLVAQALGKSPALTPEDLLNQLANNLSQAFPPSREQLFLAVGLKASFYKILDAFVLLLVSFGERVKVDLMGIGALSMPPLSKSPQVYLEMLMRTSVAIDEGAFKIRGIVSRNSYFLSKSVKLSGGFAFYAWYEDKGAAKAGDFVLMLGGYHPQFDRPNYYPTAPRVALTWYVSEQLYITAKAYFALTPAAVMMGGKMHAIWNTKHLKASFDFDMDVLLQWRPFYYDFATQVHAQLELQVNILHIHKTINLEVGVDLEIWGPAFSGRTKIDVKVFGSNFDFGLNFGAKKAAQQKINWAEFKQEFIPATQNVLTTKSLHGVVRDDNDIVIVQPKDWQLEILSQIPISVIQPVEEKSATAFGIYPMRVSDAHSELTIKFSDENMDFEIVKTVHQNLPNALWSNQPIELNSPAMLEDVLCGIVIKIDPPKSLHTAIALNESDALSDTDTIKNAWNWDAPKAFASQSPKSSNLSKNIADLTQSYRQQFQPFTKDDRARSMLRAKLVEVY